MQAMRDRLMKGTGNEQPLTLEGMRKEVEKFTKREV